jgi:hypothetical protein
MRRSHRNASILILTCSIQRTEKSWMTHLFSAVEWTRFSPLRGIVSSQPLPIVLLLCSASSFLFLLLQTQGSLHHCNANQDGALGAAWPRFNCSPLRQKEFLLVLIHHAFFFSLISAHGVSRERRKVTRSNKGKWTLM